MYVRVTVLILLIVFTCWLVLLHSTDDHLRVVFFDVGQGDAALIETPSGVQVLIDGGPDPSVLRALSKELGFFDREIDIVIATHFDVDHIGGLLDVFERYHVDRIIMTESEGTGETARAFIQKAQQETSHIHRAHRGMTMYLGDGARLEVLFPDRSAASLGRNTASVVTRLVYGDTTFLFMGDAPKRVEMYLVMLDRWDPRRTLTSDVLKVGHHGSDTSTDARFLAAVDPDIAVISASADNPYGHPHEAVLATLSRQQVMTKNTARGGSVALESDGVRIFFR